MSKELKWGETPWDNMSREELLREVQRMFSAVQSARNVMGMVRGPESDSPYWQFDGTGGRAVEKCDQVINLVTDQYDPEALYGAYYRYADDLLFTGLGMGWAVCPQCGTLTGTGRERESAAGKPCFCDGTILRALEWADLTPARADG